MASWYSQEYFFQYCLTNVPFSNLNEIIHPLSQNIPEYIDHFAGTVFVNESFWNDRISIADESKREANSDDFTDTSLSYVDILN